MALPVPYPAPPRRAHHRAGRLQCALATLLALAAVTLPATASADRSAEISIMDDQLLLGASQEEVDRDMAIFRKLGVDRLRVSAFWNQLAPKSESRDRPEGFNAADPLEPGYQFEALDRVIGSASRHGLRVMVSISTPAPLWATEFTRRKRPDLWKPSPGEFADFTAAVVGRYAPMVDHWGISNEPNQNVWLLPQSDRRGAVAPHLYRALVQASYPRIKALDPDSLALVGELASTGRRGSGPTVNLRPLRFLRAMACRDERYRPLRGGRCRNFRPVPLDAVGHHPYQLLLAPNQRSLHPDDAAINDGRRLARVIDRLIRVGALAPGRDRRPGIYYTEFGYQTNPPDPFAGVSLARQRRYLQEAGYVVWRTPRIRGLNQFRLTDGSLSGSGAQSFREFQSGLLFRNRTRKPAYGAFPNPFVISGDRFWGHVRPGGSHTVRLEHRRSRRSGFRYAGVQVLTNLEGYFSFRLPGRKPGEYRYRYSDPEGSSVILRVRR